MNQEVFLAMHNIGAFNGPLSFNINVNQRPNSNAGTIVGFTATFLANVDGVNTDISEILLDIDFAELSIGEQTVKLEEIEQYFKVVTAQDSDSFFIMSYLRR